MEGNPFSHFKTLRSGRFFHEFFHGRRDDRANVGSEENGEDHVEQKEARRNERSRNARLLPGRARRHLTRKLNPRREEADLKGNGRIVGSDRGRDARGLREAR